MRGNRRTKNTFVAVESRSLTETDGWRVRAANPRFLPTISGIAPKSWRQALPRRPYSENRRRPTTDVGVRIRERWWDDRRARGKRAPPSRPPCRRRSALRRAGNLIAGCKARLALRSSAKIANESRTGETRERLFLGE